MKLPFIPAGLMLLACQILAVPIDIDPEIEASKRIDELHKQYQHNIFKTISNRTTGCTSKNIQRRKEWSTLSKEDKHAFITAIHCLNTLPARTPLTTAPGARFLYDDFIVTHIHQTPAVHASGLFLPFHRHLVHLFQNTLRTHCAYHAPLPYWDWTKTYADPRNADVFDGSEYSLGGNGVYVPGRNPTRISLPGGLSKDIPPATGGGCVTSGPFAEGRFEVRLGPVGYEPRGPEGGLGYNPRCLTRDLSPEFGYGTRPSAVTELVDGCEDVECFSVGMDAPRGVPGGIHGSGHWQVGLNALDVYASPSDPVFWLHHAHVDRVWALWQGQNLEERTYQVWGTLTAANDPPSEEATLDTPMDFEVLGEPRTIKDTSSTIDGEYCYVYE
ncbi:uncharacterized protein C8A04DRAFT_38068 [Dichotomopilus funicola]|uniref:Tyrosinase copper-binding domain-containing protein n=1 Tax=Dichotomopilus funicola TaxID=1934379 RepID=A0AAN6V369_9PEZI|nr:hypothetical protein C8A04DRAFT_38068 [Dichotomopilus funicola]